MAHLPVPPAVRTGPVRFAPLLALYLGLGVVLQPGEAVRDEPALLAAADRLLEGHWAGPAAEPDQRAWLWHGPGLVVVLAPLVALDVPLAWMRMLSPVLLGAAVLLFHRLLRERLAPRPALLWTYAFGLYAPFALVLGTVQKEPLAILLVVAGMLALTRGLATGRRAPLAGAGLLLAALAMVRLEYGWVALALLAAGLGWWATHRGSARARRLTIVPAVAVAACLPWLAHTHELSGKVLYWSSSGGLSLFWMSPTLPGETGEWHSPVTVYEDPRLAPYRPLFRRLDDVHPLLSDLELRRRALENIRGDPWRYARNVVANTSRLFFWYPQRPPRPAAVALLLLFNGALLTGAALGLRALWRRRRHGAVAPEAWPLVVFTALAVAVHLPPSASPRMLLPIVPLLLWLSARTTSSPTGAARTPR